MRTRSTMRRQVRRLRAATRTPRPVSPPTPVIGCPPPRRGRPPRRRQGTPCQRPEPFEPAFGRLLWCHGPDGAAQWREEGAAAAHPEIAALGGIGHAGDEAQHLRPLLRRLGRKPCGLAHRPVDAVALSLGTNCRLGRGRERALSIAEPRGAGIGQQRVQGHGAAVLLRDAVQRLDLLGGGECVLGEGVEAPRAPAPAAGIGQHVGDGLEVHVPRLRLFRIARPGRRRSGRRGRPPPASLDG